MTDALFSDEDLAAGELLVAKPWRFVKGVVALEGSRTTVLWRSLSQVAPNVGKSSLINAVVRNRGSRRTSTRRGARRRSTSSRPTKRRCISSTCRATALPSAPKDKVQTWTTLIKAYLRGPCRRSGACSFSVDQPRAASSRPTAKSWTCWTRRQCRYQVVLTKGDKINEPSLEQVRRATEKALAGHPAAFAGRAHDVVRRSTAIPGAARHDGRAIL